MKNNWDNKTLTKVREIADKHLFHNGGMKHLTDNDLREFLDIFVKATEKVTKETADNKPYDFFEDYVPPYDAYEDLKESK